MRLNLLARELFNAVTERLSSATRLCLRTAEGKASRSSDERNRGLRATLERGTDRAGTHRRWVQPIGVLRHSLAWTRKMRAAPPQVGAKTRRPACR